MSIKSDKWIRRMAAEHGMIEPFEAGQVRSGEHGRVISYGTSSYGYDVRCSNQFKVFTNINSAIVDPKNFDEKSFVDILLISQLPFEMKWLSKSEFFKIPLVGWMMQMAGDIKLVRGDKKASAQALADALGAFHAVGDITDVLRLLKGGKEAGWKLVDATRMISITANLGDAKTTITHPATTTHSQLNAEQQAAAGITPGLVRLAVGIEHIDDILADLDQALAASK